MAQDSYEINIDTSAGIKNLQKLQDALKRLASYDLSKLAGGGFGSGIAKESKVAESGLGSLIGKFAAAGAAAYAFGNAFKKAFDIKAAQESAQLGITALLGSMYEFRDASGKILTGDDKLKAASQEAVKQLDAIRLAGLKTSATGEEIQESFKVALGTGSIAGLDPDQINKVTLGLIQAGKALSLKGSDQLSSEIRAVLSGEQIDNSSIAKALQLDGERIKELIKTGKLYDVLNEKLKIYGDLEEETSKTFAVLAGNIGETYDIVLQKAVEGGAFDTIKKTLAGIPRAILDDQGNIKSEFAGFVDFIAGTFNAVSVVISDIINGIMTVAQDFSGFLSENDAALEQTGNAIALVWDAVKGVIGTVYDIISSVVGALVGAELQSGELADGFTSVAKIIAIVNDGVKGFAGTILNIAGRVLGTLLRSVASVARAFDAVFKTNTAAKVDAIASGFDKIAASGKRLAEQGLGATAQTELALAEAERKKKQQLLELEKKRNEENKKSSGFNGTITAPKPTGTDKKKKEKDPTAELSKIADAQKKLNIAVATADFESYKSAMDLKKEELKKLLAFNEISKKESIEREYQLDKEQLDKEKALALEKVEEIKTAIANTPANNKAKILDLQAELADATGKLGEFTEKERKLKINVDINLEDVRKRTEDMLGSLQREILGLQGNSLEQSIADISANLNKALTDELVKDNPALQAALNEKAKLQYQAAYASEAQRQAGLSTSFLDIREKNIERQYDRGLISRKEKELEIKEIRQDAIKQLQKQLQILKQMAAINPSDLNLKLQVEQASDAVDELQDKLEEKNSFSDYFKDAGSSLKDFLKDAAEGSKKIGEAFLDMVRKITDGLLNKSIDKLTDKAFDGLDGLFGDKKSPSSEGKSDGGGILSGIQNWFSGIFTSSNGNSIFSGIQNWFSGIFSNGSGSSIMSMIGGWFSSLFSSIGGLFSGSGGGGLLSGLGSMFGGFFAGGGAITGRGTGTSDSMLIRASNGEFMFKASTVRKLGTGLLNYINQTGTIPTGFASGGAIGAPILGSSAANVTANFSPEIVMYANEMEEMLLSSRSLEKKMERIVIRMNGGKPLGR